MRGEPSRAHISLMEPPLWKVFNPSRDSLGWSGVTAEWLLGGQTGKFTLHRDAQDWSHFDQTSEVQGKSLAESQHRPNPQPHTTTTRAYLPLENPLVWDACEKGTYHKAPDSPQSKELLENEEGYLSHKKKKRQQSSPCFSCAVRKESEKPSPCSASNKEMQADNKAKPRKSEALGRQAVQ